MNKKYLLIFLLVLGTAFWGISFPVTKMAVEGVSQSTFLLYRFLLATVVLALVLHRQLNKITKKHIFDSISLAIPLLIGINFQTLGLKHSTASQCAFVAGTSVVVIPIIKLLVYRSRIDGRIWLAAIIALLGLAVISIKDNLSVSIGDLYTIIGTFGFAAYLIRVEQLSAEGNIVPTIVPMFLACTLVMLCVAGVDPAATWFPQGRGFWTGIIYCALFSTAYMYTISNIAQQYISAEKVAIIYLFEPVFAAVAAILLLGEGLSWRLLIGGILILIGTLVSEIKFKRQPSGVLER
ncbi:DMT family transporter [Chitinophaga pendula]|uniref:DMT family transporter n=1 Tax=Chitinophaga TaxID=79328 RepID=UPI000BAEC424|nr:MULTISPECIES: DMT family transporter [Chitinophaga]ASZ12139.1 EamA family transporter [Chitinophaga sp. MD30]UCJ04821.1 DMT family transporter [Chitinophaga pendula]